MFRPSPNQLQGRKFLIKIGIAIIILYAIRGRDVPDYYGRRKITMPTQHNKIPEMGLPLKTTGCAVIQKVGYTAAKYA